MVQLAGFSCPWGNFPVGEMSRGGNDRGGKVGVQLGGGQMSGVQMLQNPVLRAIFTTESKLIFTFYHLKSFKFVLTIPFF